MAQDAKENTDHQPSLADHLYIAVDLGAGSGRVFLCDLSEKFTLEEIHRFTYPPREKDGHLRWDFQKIFSEIKSGLKKTGARARELNREIYSLGVDSWGVDYGLIDAAGNLIADPICYRDARTNGAMEKVFAAVPKKEIFEKTGIQFLNFNTIFQLSSENGTLLNAEKLLLLPDLINYFLTGKYVAEYTNATTTQFLDAATKNWDSELLERLQLPAKILPPVVPAGTEIGSLTPEIAAQLELENVHVIAPATHDTGSAIAGAPLEKNWAYISSGTWSLVGVERSSVLINEAVARENFTNEGGAFGTIRFLKNVMGLWIFESCRREWKERGVETDYESLLREVEKIGNFEGFIFPDDERFLNPSSMLAAIKNQLQETGQKFSEDPIVVTKIILDSLAFRYASVLQIIENLTNQKIAGVQIVGGGGRNEYLNQITANASGKRVKAGLTEATVTGNALVQAVAAGKFADLSAARKYVAENFELKVYEPKIDKQIEMARDFYRKVESLFLNERATA